MKLREAHRRYNRSRRGLTRYSIYKANRTIKKYTPGTPEYQANMERVMSQWTN